MRILISTLLYLVISMVSVNAQDRFDESDIPQTTRECRLNLSSLGRLIRKHNPDEEHMIRLRKQARMVSRYCQDEKFSRAYRLFLKIQASIKSVNNTEKDITPSTERRIQIKQCLDKLRSVGAKVMAAHLTTSQSRRVKAIGKAMHKNCRLQRFRRADRDHRAILKNLKRFVDLKEARTGPIRTARGCRSKVKNLNSRLNYRKLSQQVRTWVRKSTREIIRLCRHKKYDQAEKKYQTALTDFAQYLNPEVKPMTVAASPEDMKNCQRSYTLSFKMINSRKMPYRQKRKLLAKRKILGQYCYEKDFANAKLTFKELRREINKMNLTRSASSNNTASYTEQNIRSNTITAQNCAKKINILEDQASNMNLSSRNARGLQSGRNRIKALCDRENYRGASLWHKRVQKRMLQLSKDRNRYRRRIVRSEEHTNRSSSRRSAGDMDQKSEEKASCLLKYKSLARRIVDDARSFRLRTKLRLKAALMRRACKRKRFDDASDIYQNATQALDRQ